MVFFSSLFTLLLGIPLGVILATTAPGGIYESAQLNRVLGSAPYNTAPLNLSGHPALSLPNGIGTKGMPTSVQLVGRRFDEARVLQVGHIIESESHGTGGANT